MKAIVYEKYGQPDVLELREIEKPAPKADEVLIKIHAVSLNQADWHLLTADIFLIRFMGGGVLKPKQKILGADVAGEIEAVGKNVKTFRVGDQVFGDLAACGFGGLAEYAVAPANLLVLKPENISFPHAAAVPMAAVTALQGLRDVGKIQPGQNVLIQGAAGGVGTFAVQIAKMYSAHVTAVCSTRNLEQARALGADHVIDYTKQDFTRNGKQYDLILAANGYHPLADYKRALAPNGKYVMAGGSFKQMMETLILGGWNSRNGRKMANVSAQTSQKDLLFLKEKIEAGKIKPAIDRCYPFAETADAFRYLGQGHARAKVIITM